MEYSFDVLEARKYGVDEAIMLKNFKFWILKNKANNRHFYDGRTWTYNSHDSFTKIFDFWTESQIKRILKSLISQGVLITGNYNETKYDRTLWYALVNEKSLSENSQMENSVSTNPKVKTAITTYTDNKPNDKPDSIIPIPTKKKVKVKIKREPVSKNPPTLEEIQAYIKEKGYCVDAKKFYDFFDSNNWIDSKNNPVYSWKQKIVTWNGYGHKSSSRPKQISTKQIETI
jgi:hypothetical protein